MKHICFLQTSNESTICEHRHALALTFPYLINELSKFGHYDYSLYVEGRTKEPFDTYIENNKPDYVFITAITATFPNAVKFAKIAKKYNCKVVLGGPFASLNAIGIHNGYKEFDVILSGMISDKIMTSTINKNKIINGKKKLDINFRLSDILNKSIFDIYSDDPVCYDLGFGCMHKCTFCTMRSIWSNQHLSYRCVDNVLYDLNNIKKWKTLKIIDDDILLSKKLLRNVSISNTFDKVIAETRADNINRETVKVLKEFGITHLMIGVESFDDSFLRESLKYSKKNWGSVVGNAISLCIKEGIIARPVLQMLHPGMQKNYLSNILPIIKDWKIGNGIQLFFVFFTPHPGLKYCRVPINNYITNDLSLFNHFNPVYRPESFKQEDIIAFIEEYNNILENLEIEIFNAKITYHGSFLEEYNVFFP